MNCEKTPVLHISVLCLVFQLNERPLLQQVDFLLVFLSRKQRYIGFSALCGVLIWRCCCFAFPFSLDGSVKLSTLSSLFCFTCSKGERIKKSFFFFCWEEEKRKRDMREFVVWYYTRRKRVQEVLTSLRGMLAGRSGVVFFFFFCVYVCVRVWHSESRVWPRNCDFPRRHLSTQEAVDESRNISTLLAAATCAWRVEVQRNAF